MGSVLKSDIGGIFSDMRVVWVDEKMKTSHLQRVSQIGASLGQQGWDLIEPAAGTLSFRDMREMK